MRGKAGTSRNLLFSFTLLYLFVIITYMQLRTCHVGIPAGTRDDGATGDGNLSEKKNRQVVGVGV